MDHSVSQKLAVCFACSTLTGTVEIVLLQHCRLVIASSMQMYCATNYHRSPGRSFSHQLGQIQLEIAITMVVYLC